MATKQTSTRKRSTTKATATKPPAKTAPAKAATRGRAPVHTDAEITRFIRGELAKARKAGTTATTAGTLRDWRAQGL